MSDEHHYALPAGHRLGNYEIIRLLGHGGFGLTYLARDLRLGRIVAIKELMPLDFAVRGLNSSHVVARSAVHEENMRWARDRFLEEGRTLAALRHPAILPVHELLETNNTVYLVTEFIEGPDCESWLQTRPGRPSEAELITFTKVLLEALSQVHALNYLHRDIKPQNILMRAGSDRPVLIDFGNARISSGERTQNLTAVLSRYYAPFEQYQSQGRQGPYTDLYSLGAVIHRAIVGKPPEEAPNRVEDDPQPLLSGMRISGYSNEFLLQVDKAISVRRDLRWASAADWLWHLENGKAPGSSAAATGFSSPNPSAPVTSRTGGLPSPPPPPPPPFARIRMAAVGAGAGITAVAAFWMLSRPAKESGPLAARATVPAAKSTGAVEEAQAKTRAEEEARIKREKQEQEEERLRKEQGDATAAKLRKQEQEQATLQKQQQEELARRQRNAEQLRGSYSRENPYINGLKMEFVPVPGSSPRILMCRWETRVRDFRPFVRETGWKPAAKNIVALSEKTLSVLKMELSWDSPGFPQGEFHPVVGVRWDDAVHFCSWLSTSSSGGGGRYRLPSSAEWSKAANNENINGNFFGEEWVKRTGKQKLDTVSSNDGYAFTSPAGEMGRNMLGISDLKGNAAEWCLDDFSMSQNSSSENAVMSITGILSPQGNTYKVTRGGSWLTMRPTMLATSFHNRQDPDEASAFVGFRVVLELDSLHPAAK